MTYREYVEKNYPDRVSEKSSGGIMGCPFNYFVEAPLYHGRKCERLYMLDFEEACNCCWDNEIPLDAVDVHTGAPVYPAEP